MAASFGRFRRGVGQQVIFVLLFVDLLHSAEQVVGIRNDEAAGALGKLVKNLLIGQCAIRDTGHQDFARPVERILPVWVEAITSAKSTIGISATSGVAFSGVWIPARGSSAPVETARIAAIAA